MNTKKESKRELILNANILKTVLIIATPLILNQIVQAFYHMVDTIFADNIAGNGLAALAFVTPIMGFLLAIGMGVSVAVTALVARKIGKQEISEAKNNVAIAILISMSLATIITVLGFIFSYQFMIGLGAHNAYSYLASQYFRYTVLSVPLVFILNIYLGYKSARGDTLAVMIITLIGVVLKFFLTWLFVGILDMGVFGLGLATLVSNAVQAAIAFVDLFIVKSQYRISIKDFKINKQIIIPFVIMMLPIMLERTSLSFSHILVNMFITPFDPSVIAAYGLANKINGIIFAVGSGMGAGLIPIVAQNLSVNNTKRSKQAIYVGLLIGLFIQGIMLMFLFIFQGQIIQLFTSDVNVIYHATDALNVFAFTALMFTIMQVAVAVFYASGYSYIPIIISVLRLFVFRIPTLWLMLEFSQLAEMSIWLAMMIANVAAALISVGFMFVIKWQRPPKYLQIFNSEENEAKPA